MDQESLQRWENARLFSDRTSKMEVQSKLGPMVGWPVRKDVGTSKAMFMWSNWESKTHKARARRSHTAHRDRLKQSTTNVYRWRYSIYGIDTEHYNTRTTNYNNRRSANDISNLARTQPGIDGAKSICVLLEKGTIWKTTKAYGNSK